MTVAEYEGFARVMPGVRLSAGNLHALAVYLRRTAVRASLHGS